MGLGWVSIGVLMTDGAARTGAEMGGCVRRMLLAMVDCMIRGVEIPECEIPEGLRSGVEDTDEWDTRGTGVKDDVTSEEGEETPECEVTAELVLAIVGDVEAIAVCVVGRTVATEPCV